MVEPSGVSGTPRILLRAEGAAILALSLLVYAKLGPSWLPFVVLFLAPDLSFLGYLVGARTGAVAYNTVHTLIGPLALIAAGFMLPAVDLFSLALIWTAHIGVDRMLGFGLKYGAGFRYTHLGQIGRASADKL